MKALQIAEPGKCQLVDLAIPAPGSGEVLLAVKVVGFCGSDLSTFRGLNPLVEYPRIPGHEIGAEIKQIGENVPDRWQVGQRVLVQPYTSCGECSACRQGRRNCCRDNQTLGVQRDGAMTEYIVTPYAKLLASEKLDFAELALVEPLTVGFHAVDRARVADADTVLVFGCGAIGLGAIAGAAARGARVIAVDVADGKLALAAACGAAEGINSGTTELHAALSELTSGEGPEVIIEAVGLPQTFRSAVEEACFAGRVVYIGYAKQAVEYETKHFVQKELDILGSRNATPTDFRAVMQHLESGKFPTGQVISRTTSLAEAPASLQQWNAAPGEFTKIQVAF